MQTKRTTGYHWVKLAGTWQVASYDSDYNSWQICGQKTCHRDDEFTEIDERRILRSIISPLNLPNIKRRKL